jgi:small-conductance mechanosensitive channel
MGTVEKISIRSMQLRHHRGLVNTVPYGSIEKVTNFSRDWVIMKLIFTVPFDTDPNKVKKIFKKIGAEMLEDPLYKDDFLEPFKSQGVFQFDDVGIVMRGKFMAKPGTQFTIRKEIYNRVRKEFDANGIEFARREVRVAIPSLDGNDEVPSEQKAAIAGAVSGAVQAHVEEQKIADVTKSKK